MYCEGNLNRIKKKPLSPQIEISETAELNEQFLQDELHPKKNLHRPKFAKPKPPPGRGARRMTKPAKGAEEGS